MSLSSSTVQDSTSHSSSLGVDILGRDDHKSQQVGSEVPNSERKRFKADKLLATENGKAEFGAAKVKQAECDEAELEAALELAREYCLLDNGDHEQALIRAQLNDLGLEPSGFDGQFYSSPLSLAKRVGSNYSSTTCDCDACGLEVGERFFCNVCNENYCDSCWKAQRVHRSGKLTVDNIPHERTNYKACDLFCRFLTS